MITAAPLIALVLKRLGYPTGVAASASRSWVVEGPTETHNRPARFDPADLDKVTAAAAGSTLAYQLDRLTRASTRHPPVRAHLLRDVYLLEGCLVKWNLFERLSNVRLRITHRPETEFSHGAFASSYLGYRFFGHWLLDDIPLAMLAESTGLPIGYLGSGHDMSAHQIQYEHLLSPTVLRVSSAFFRELVVFDYCTESIDKAKRYATLKARLRLGGERPRRPGVMLLRKASGQPRVLINEIDIANRVAARGFAIVDPMQVGAAELADICQDAHVVIGCEGSHLAHAFLPMAFEGTMVVLQPPFKFDNFWRDRTNSVGASYACIVGDAVEGGFHVPVERLERLLDSLET